MRNIFAKYVDSYQIAPTPFLLLSETTMRKEAEKGKETKSLRAESWGNSLLGNLNTFAGDPIVFMENPWKSLCFNGNLVRFCQE